MRDMRSKFNDVANIQTLNNSNREKLAYKFSQNTSSFQAIKLFA